ncbi:MAG: hypothetical protein FWG68_04540 [Defluviitaleaceae bacterium]|nr:hypothetical protein [Defluviitaleaceae bacterium]
MKKIFFALSAVLFLSAIMPTSAIARNTDDSTAVADSVPTRTGDYPKFDGSPLPEFPFTWRFYSPDGTIVEITAIGTTQLTARQERLLALQGHDCGNPIWVVSEQSRLDVVNDILPPITLRFCWTCGFVFR